MASKSDDIAAHVRDINALVAGGQPDKALAAVDTALDAAPGALPLLVRRGVVLRALKHNDAAVTHFRDLMDRFPADTPVRYELAGTLSAVEEFDEALALYEAILAEKPDHAGALAGRVNVALAQGDAQAALEAADRGVAAQPGDKRLLMKRATALRALQDYRGAADHLRAMLERFPGDMAVRHELSVALNGLAEFEAALALQAEILAADPRHRGALLGRINARLGQGRFDDALEAADAALAVLPGDKGIAIKRGVALRALDRHGPAVAHFEALLEQFPGDRDVRRELAQTYRSGSDIGAALKINAELLEEEPQRPDALLGQVDMLLERGDHQAALQLLETAGKASDGAGLDEAVRRLKAVEIAQHLKGGARTEDLAYLAAHPDALNPKQLWRLFSICEKAGQMALAGQAVAALLDRPLLPYDIALNMVRRLHAIGQDATLDRMLPRLLTLIGDPDRGRFELDVAVVRHGPIAAVATARAQRVAGRDERAAVQLARILSDAGEARLAARYLRRCLRVFAPSRALVSAMVHALLESGAPEQAMQYLRIIERQGKSTPGRYDDLRAATLLELGRLQDIHQDTEVLGETIGYDKSLKMRLNMEISLGNLEAARTLFDKMAESPVTSEKFAKHRSISLLGMQINELGAYRREHASDPAPDHAVAEDALRFTYPARRAVAAFMDRRAAPPTPPPGGNRIPRRIVQYWDSPAPPEDIAFLIGLWDSAPRFDSVLFDRKTARAHVAGLGSDWARAFDLARNPAEESDFFRLCYLMTEGGIYVDADDRYVRDFSPLIETAGALLIFAEPYGTVENNFIAARAGHPAVTTAAHAAREALLRRESEIVWSKTGPGLLTRAVGHYILDQGRAARAGGLTVLPRYRLRPYIQIHIPLAYKKTNRYWNAASREQPAEFQAMVERALAGAGLAKTGPDEPEPAAPEVVEPAAPETGGPAAPGTGGPAAPETGGPAAPETGDTGQAEAATDAAQAGGGKPDSGQASTAEPETGRARTGRTKTARPKTGRSKAGKTKPRRPKTGQTKARRAKPKPKRTEAEAD